MNEQQKALESIKFWLITFCIWFLLFSSISIATGFVILRDISAYNQCVDVYDNEFRACYESAKR